MISGMCQSTTDNNAKIHCVLSVLNTSMNRLNVAFVPITLMAEQQFEENLVEQFTFCKRFYMFIVSTLSIFNRANALTKYLRLCTCVKVCFWPYCLTATQNHCIPIASNSYQFSLVWSITVSIKTGK